MSIPRSPSTGISFDPFGNRKKPGSRDDKGRVELRHLRYFIAVAEERNVSRAAARLGIAQPPLSQQIRQFEQFLQVTLFQRTSRGVELTPAAVNLLDQAKSVLARIDAMVETVREVGRGERGEFHLGSVYSGLFLVVPTIVQDFTDRFPHAIVNFREMSVNEQVVALQQGQLDVGIVRYPIEDSHIRTMVLLEEPVVVAMPISHPLAASAAVSLSDISHEWVLLQGGNNLSFKKQAGEIFRRNGVPSNGLYDVPELNTLLGLVDAGMGIAVVPRSASALKYSNVVFRPILEETPPFVLAAAWNPDRELPMREAFIEVAIRSLKRKSISVIPEGAHGSGPAAYGP